MKPHPYIARDYPHCTAVEIAEAFHPAKGWIQPFGVQLPSLSTGNLAVLQGSGYTHVNLRITDSFGMVSYPDYSIDELTKSKDHSHEELQ
jgi:hypothetical protein